MKEAVSKYTTPKYRKQNMIKNRKYRKTSKYKNTIKKWLTGNQENLLRVRARVAVCSALKRGLIVKQSCEDCGAIAEAHHDSYKPKDKLKVRWFCKLHHEKWHTKNKAVYI